VALFVVASSASSPGTAASATVRVFYAWYQHEGASAWDNLAEAKRFLDPTFFAVIARGDQNNAFDFAPFENAQWGAQSFSFGAPIADGARVLVPVRAQREGHPPLVARLTIVVTRGADGRYVIDDVIYPAPISSTLRVRVAVEINQCNRGTTYDIRMCWGKQSDAATAELASTYARVVATLRKLGIDRAPLTAAQAAWDEALDKMCAFEYKLYLPGTIAPQLEVECDVRMTRMRTGRLKAWLAALLENNVAVRELPASAAAATEFNRVYGRYLPRLTSSQRAELVAAERAWEVYRDKVCAIERGSCLTEVTNERVVELEASWVGEPFW
jgi:uncharacterized protein YecT (DUF1311 family)